MLKSPPIITATPTWIAPASHSLLLLGAGALAFEPAGWLLRTWYAPGYDSFGVAAFALVTGLFVASWRTPLAAAVRPASGTRTIALLIATASLRCIAQILDINVIGALLLCVDVYALAHLARLGERRFAVSPLYLAGLFCFCLPIEPIVQRLLGYGLQHLSADLACAMLRPWFADLACAGVRIRLNDTDVLVDLPCSGAALLSLSGLIYLVMATLKRPAPAAAMMGAGVCALLALGGNSLRVSLLALGIAFAEQLPINVMDPIPHAAVGLLMVALVTLGLLAWYARTEPAQPTQLGPYRSNPAWRAPHYQLAFASLFCAAAFAIHTLQPRPVDASAPLAPPTLPLYAGDFAARPLPLTRQEHGYFAQFGGNAARASYGPYGLLLVSTTSPLRHLHNPTVCLGGMGFAIRLLGTDHATTSTLYHARRGTDEYLVSVAYQADDQRLASSIAEVVWHWLQAPSQRWTMIQRIEPISPDIDPTVTERWHAAIRRAFNLA